MRSALLTRVLGCVLLLWGLLAGPAGAQGWRQLPGTAVDVAVGANGAVWMVGTSPVAGGYTIHQWDGNSWVQLPGGAVRVAVDPRGQAWIVNNSDEIYIRENNAWRRMPGSAKDIGIGADGTVWVVGTTRVPGGYSVHRWDGQSWGPADAGAMRISVDPRGQPWIVNDVGSVFARQAGAWRQLPGTARDVAIGANGAVWSVQNRAVPGGQAVAQWTGSAWDEVDGGGMQIAVGPDGMPWLVNSANQIFRRMPAETASAGPSTTTPGPMPAGRWRELRGGANDIGVGANGAVWIVGTNPVAGGYGVYQLQDRRWVATGTGAVRVAVDPKGQAWLVNARDEIYSRNNNSWQRMPGFAKDIGIGADGTVWVVGTARVSGGHGLYRWDGQTWEPVGGGAVRIAVDPRGQPWIVNDVGTIYVREGDGWRQLPGTAVDIGVGADGAVWAVLSRDVLGGHAIARWTGDNWAEVDGGAKHIAVGPQGVPWVVNNRNIIYVRQ